MSSYVRPSSQRGYTTEPLNSTPREHRANKLSYEPHLFDIINVAAQVRDLGLNIDIPSTYLQAASVDSAKLVGHGASFTASVRFLPPGPERAKYTVDMDGVIITKDSKAPSRPKFVLYKTARIAFSKTGYPMVGYKRALQSVLTELHALTYPPLFRHPNIITFLGLAWATNEFDVGHRLPALIVEYAEHGTLANVLSTQDVSTDLAQSFCFDVACGLSAIHTVGLVHGDIKPDNVLICQGVQRKVAKLGDFGYSVVAEFEQEEAFIGGTKPWRAPETTGSIPLDNLHYTDTYSLGLLIWSVSLGGTSPFDLILDNPSEEAIEAMKTSDSLLASSATTLWRSKYVLQAIRRVSQSEECANVPTYMEKARSLYNPFDPPEAMVSETITTTSQESSSDQLRTARALQQPLDDMVERDALFSRLDRIFQCSLAVKPESRNLEEIVKILRPGVSPAGPRATWNAEGADQKTANATEDGDSREKTSENGTYDQLSWLKRGYMNNWFRWGAPWQYVRSLTPGMQELVYNALINMMDAQSQFFLAAICINGYGCEQDIPKALDLLRKAADFGDENTCHNYSQGYVYRLHKACGVSNVSGYDLAKCLHQMARIGSRAAFIDLQDAGMMNLAGDAGTFVRNRLNGVGADFFTDGKMLHGLTLGSWLDKTFLMEKVKRLADLNTYAINQHGDTLLHMTACCGEHEARIWLVQHLGMDVNCRNGSGDTPLISLCRSGNGESAIIFLQKYKADASLANVNGETALHWLISFRDDAIDPLARDLVAQGAVVDAATTVNVCYSVFRGTADFDFQMPGTPLQWAVHHNKVVAVRKLLSLGADPQLRSPGGKLTPLEWAAHFHHAECLKLMIEHLEQQHANSGSHGSNDKLKALFYGPLLLHCIHAADTFSMMLRNSHHYLDQLHATLDIIRQKTILIVMANNFGADGWTPLYYAINEGHGEVIEYMLTKGWHADEINEVCGTAMMTPFLEAVRWNRLPLIKLLVQHGADVYAQACNLFNDKVRDWSALHILATEGLTNVRETLKYLLEAGLRVEEANENSISDTLTDLQSMELEAFDTQSGSDKRIGETAFSCALRNNAFSLCDEFLRLGASPNAFSTTAGLFTVAHPTTILGHVIISNARHSIDRLRYLLSNDRTTFIVEQARGVTALHRAALGCTGVSSVDGLRVRRIDFDWDTNRGIMRQLVGRYSTTDQLNAKCFIRGRTALHLAVETGNTGGKEILLDAGADPNIRDDDGQIPNDLSELVEVDLPGVNADESRPLKWTTTADIADGSELTLEEQLDIPSLSHGGLTANDETRNVATQREKRLAEGSSACTALTSENSIATKLLTERGVDVSEMSSCCGFTLLNMAAKFGYLDIVKFLIDVDVAHVSTPNRDGLTPLHAAALCGHLEVVKALVRAKADIFKKDVFGWTPLSLAVQSGHLSVAEYLLRGDWNGRTREIVTIEGTAYTKFMGDSEDLIGRTPLHFASQMRHGAIVELLISNNADACSLDCYGRRSYYWIDLDPDLRPKFEVQIRSVAPSTEFGLNRVLRRSIHKLTSFLIRNEGRPTTPGYRELGHCLIYRNNPEDAITAFEQLLTFGETRDDVWHHCTCDSCNAGPIHGVRHVCTVCADIDLCDECWTQKDNSVFSCSCREHEFLAVPNSRWTKAASARFIADGRLLWLQRLQNTFIPAE